jgi:hypothetical protein
LSKFPCLNYTIFILFPLYCLKSQEGNKVFRYDGTNQNTLNAWIREDTPEEENARVEVKDSFGFYTWHRKKSNDNVRGKIENGKGFSFFFARYAYFDKFKYRDESCVTNIDPKYSSILATVPFNKISYFDSIKNDRSIMKKLDPSNSVLLIIDTNGTDIISATYTEKEEYLWSYIENRRKILMQEHEKVQGISEGQQWLRERLESSVEKELYRMLTEGYKQFSDFLSDIRHEN